jgi:Ca2+-binding RTX toxin-like protein
MNLQLTSRVASGSGAIDTDIRDLIVARLDGVPMLFSATGTTGGLAAYRLDGQGRATLVDTARFSDGLPPLASTQLDLARLDGQMHVMVGGTRFGDLAGYDLDGFGRLGALSLTRVSSDRSALTGWSATSDGAWTTPVYSTEPGQSESAHHVPLSGAAQLARVQVGGQDYLLATATGEKGVISYDVDTMSETDRADDADGLGIAVPKAIATGSAHGATWVILAAAGTGTLSVLRLSADGTLDPTDHVMDTRDTRFGKVQAMDAVEVGGRLLVFAGGTDDGLAMLTLAPDGRLVHLESLVHRDGRGLENVTGIEAVRLGDAVHVYVTSATVPGISQYTVDLSTLGATVDDASTAATRIYGTAGDDLLFTQGADTVFAGHGDDVLIADPGATLHGGSGADIFVIRWGTGTVQIRDFNSAEDRLDLSHLPMLRGPGQLATSLLPDGFTLSYRGTEVRVHAHDGGGLHPDDLWPTGRFGTPDRFAIIPPDDPDPKGPVQAAAPVDTAIYGFMSNDTLSLGAADEVIWARGGDDVVLAEAGADIVRGGGGRDTIDGGDGHDTIMGGTSSDNLRGGRGQDVLNGQRGDDLIRGEGGADTLSGEGGRDRLLGANGADSLQGNAGRDTLDGGRDADTLEGGGGHDLLFGRNGFDTLYAGGGHDTVDGGNDADRLFGGPGNDLLLGGGGDDSVIGSAG